MQASTPLCCLRHSAHANHLESTSQTFPKRHTILPASCPAPPIITTIGEAKINGLQPDCAEVSFVNVTLHEAFTIINFQQYKQSFVNPSFNSSTLPQKPYITHLTLSTSDTDATLINQSVLDSNTNTLVINTVEAPTQPKRRDLTPIQNRCDSMISIASAPGTPPELTESRSSKSSSYDSQFSTENDLSTEITNFEEIGLDDDHRSATVRNHQEGRSQSKAGARVDTYHTRRPTLPELKCQIKARGIDGASRKSIAGSMKRGFTSPSPITLASQSSRPRSSSPPKHLPRSNSCYSINEVGSQSNTSPRSSFGPSRRGSWQPTRKTIKEIEAEYHDSDDELPEDASLWNVPISPFHSTNVSPRTSFRGSPEPESFSREPRPIPLEHTQSTPDIHPRQISVAQSGSRQRLSTRSSSASRSNPTSPRMPNYMRSGRPKSWNIAMAELSPEARVVSENLVYHTDASKSKEQIADKSTAANRSSAPGAIQLPPIQKGALDFMPISKEKEAVLSRTRPSWLPPKNPKEEQKHLREYQRMMAASIEAEKKKESRLKSVLSQKDTTRESLNKIWDYYINPTTDITIIDKRVHDLCWRGIPSRIRGKVWQRAVGNPLGLSTKTYNKAIERVRIIKAKTPQDLSQLERSIASWFADIDRDAETAFPELRFFQRNGPLWQDLVNICEAYACYRSDIGYLYGLQLIGALVLLQIPDPGEAFIFMANCLNKQIPMAFHTSDVATTQRTYNRVVSNLGVKFPRLHDYLFEPMERGGLGFTGQEVFEPMFRTLFSNGLDFDRLCRVWDIWIFEGDRTLVRSAVAILGSLQSQIFDVTGDLYLKRRNVQEMLGWGPFNRSEKSSCWKLELLGNEETFVDEIEAAGKLDYTGR